MADKKTSVQKEDGEVIESYSFNAGGMPVEVKIVRRGEFVPYYMMTIPGLGQGTGILLDTLKGELVTEVKLEVSELVDPKKAEVLFEAMHTGHAMYATIHADNAQEAISRLLSPPLNIPASTLSPLSAIVVQYRHRKLGIRRTLEFAEVLKSGEVNVVQRWDPKTDRLREITPPSSLADTLALYGGMSPKEIKKDVSEKASIIEWASRHRLDDVNTVGMITGPYCEDPEYMLDFVQRDVP